MKIIYEGVDITKDVTVTSAVCKDYSRGKSDSLDITFDHANRWYQWKPQNGDKIEIEHRQYKTGSMFISAISPEGNRYRILATAAKYGARQKASKCYQDTTLESLMQIVSAEAGMGYKIYGLDPKRAYRCLIRHDESAAAFLSRLAAMEGAVLKCYAGKFTMIGIDAAQSLPAAETIALTTRQAGVIYQKVETEKYKTFEVLSGSADITAQDMAVQTGLRKTVCELPARDNATAGRWARGLLLSHNRKAEMLEIETDFRPEWSAMVRLDVTGKTAMDGKWIIDAAVHDFVQNTTKASLLRVIDTVR